MAAHDNASDIYEQLIDISEMSFAGGHYEVAYHVLIAALYWANDLHSIQRLQAVERLANEQINWIDTYYPSYKHSTESARVRGNQGIYDTLLRQAASMIRVLELGRQ